MFEQLDVNKDRVIDLTEFTRFCLEVKLARDSLVT